MVQLVQQDRLETPDQQVDQVNQVPKAPSAPLDVAVLRVSLDSPELLVQVVRRVLGERLVPQVSRVPGGVPVRLAAQGTQVPVVLLV